MRGFPFFNLVICLIVSGTVLLPLVYRATGVPRAVAAVAYSTAKVEPGSAVQANVRLEFVSAPVNVRIKTGDTVLHEWKPAKPDTELEEDISFPASEGRSEFTVQIEWPAGTPRTNAILRIEPDHLPAREVVIWSREARADQLIAITWKEPNP